MAKEVLEIPVRTREGSGIATRALADCLAAKPGTKLEVWPGGDAAQLSEIKSKGETWAVRTAGRLVAHLRKRGIYALQRRGVVFARIGDPIPTGKAQGTMKPVKTPKPAPKKSSKKPSKSRKS